MLDTLAIVLTSATVILGCGGRTAVDESPSYADGGVVDSNLDELDECAPAGIRLCGGGCPARADCVGGCELSSGTVAGLGVCWADLSDRGTRPCSVCADGEVCAYKAPDRLVCVPVRSTCER